jgi:hypothetical protein
MLTEAASQELDGSKTQTYYVASLEHIKAKGQISQCTVNDYKSKYRKWSSYNEFKEIQFSVWKNNLKLDSEFESTSCSCPSFFKHYSCKHVIVLGIRKRILIPPLEAKSIPIGMKRKRGRPARAKPAIFVQ